MLGDGFGHSIEYALEIIKFARLLYFHDDNISFGIFGLDVNSVVLVVLCIWVALAFENFDDFHFLVQ